MVISGKKNEGNSKGMDPISRQSNIRRDVTPSNVSFMWIFFDWSDTSIQFYVSKPTKKFTWKLNNYLDYNDVLLTF